MRSCDRKVHSEFVQSVTCTFYLKHCHSKAYTAAALFSSNVKCTDEGSEQQFIPWETDHYKLPALQNVYVQYMYKEQYNCQHSQKIVNVDLIHQWNKIISGWEFVLLQRTFKSNTQSTVVGYFAVIGSQIIPVMGEYVIACLLKPELADGLGRVKQAPY